MNKNSKVAKTVRLLAIFLMGITSIFMLLGGIGSTCVAWGAENYDSFTVLADYKLLYQTVAIVTIGVALAGTMVTVALGRGRPWAYKAALVTLLVGLIAASAQMIASELLRGSSAPNNIRVYTAAFTLVVFLFLGLSRFRNSLFTGSSGRSTAGGTGAGVTLMVAGVTTLTVHLWAGPTHTVNSVNYAAVWHTQLLILGAALLLAGVGLLLRYVLAVDRDTRAPVLSVEQLHMRL